jgi:hypothetical protein
MDRKAIPGAARIYSNVLAEHGGARRYRWNDTTFNRIAFRVEPA